MHVMYLNIKPVTYPGCEFEHNRVKLIFDYYNGSQPVLTFQIGRHAKTGDSAAFLVLIYTSPRKWFPLADAWPRKNAKKFNLLVDDVVSGIKAKTSETYKTLVEFLRENGTELTQ